MKWIPLVVLVTGCAQLHNPEPPPLVPAPASQTPPEPTPPPTLSTPLPVGALADLLSAEIALLQGDPDSAYPKLKSQAQQTQDLGLIQRAARVATQLSPEIELDAALRYAAQAPDSFEAQILLARAYLNSALAKPSAESLLAASELRPEQPLGFVRNLLEGKPELATELAKQLRLASEARAYESSQAPVGARIGIVTTRLTALEIGTGPRAALDYLAPLIDENTDSLSLLSEAARLSQLIDQDQQAIAYIQQAHRQFPDNLGVTQTLAQLLVAQEQYAQAIELFTTLIDQSQNPSPYRLSQAMLALEVEQYELAGQQATILLEQGEYTDEANLVLGSVALAGDDLLQAKQRLEQANGKAFLDARVRYAKAVVESDLDEFNEWLDDALSQRPDLSTALHLTRVDLLNEAGLAEIGRAYLDQQIRQSPLDPNLLYGRAMQRVDGDLEGAEADLLRVLEIEPNNASALNALGYTYADADINLDQALTLIGRALAERPDDAAILDSMGWVHFRLGNLDQAISWLQRAYAKLQDAEIAAHLGEALWQAGRIDEAREIWETALQDTPDNSVLNDTIERLTQP